MTGGGDGDDRDHDGDDGLDDATLGGMRSVWLSMREEEPSARGISELLAAARAQVARKPEPVPAWRRALAAIGDALRRPPVLALASVVLIAGTAVLIKSHGVALEDPAPVRIERADVVPTGQVTLAVGGRAASGSAALDETRAVAPNAPAPTPAPIASAPAPKDLKRAVHAGPSPAHMGKAAPPPADPREPDDQWRGEAAAAPPPGSGNGNAMPVTTKAPLANDTPREAPAPDSARQRESKPDVRSANTLALECQAAAARGDCAAARSLAALLKAKDADLYRNTIRDAAIAGCL